GTGADGTAALGNGGYGVEIQSTGGAVVGGNLVYDNPSGGVLVGFNSSGNTMRQNSIFGNGLTHAGPGLTLVNGANNWVAAPSLSSATLNGTTLNVTGAIVGLANVSYVLDFYANPSGDPEGKVYLGSLTVTPTTTGAQNFTFTTTTTVTGTNPLITATKTDDEGNTSAFSSGVTAGSSLESSPPPPAPQPSPQPAPSV